MTDQRPRGARRTTLRAGGLAPIVVLLAACGIQPTPVIDAGAPPSGMVVANPDPAANRPAEPGDVYLVNAGRLTPVSRPNLLDRALNQNRDDNGIELITLSLRELLTGPSAEEAAVGITSELPLQPSQTPLQVTSPTPTTVQLVMNMVTDKLSPLAARQITCTVRAAAQAAGRPPDVGVLREHDDGRVESLPRCPEDLGP